MKWKKEERLYDQQTNAVGVFLILLHEDNAVPTAVNPGQKPVVGGVKEMVESAWRLDGHC